MLKNTTDILNSILHSFSGDETSITRQLRWIFPFIKTSIRKNSFDVHQFNEICKLHLKGLIRFHFKDSLLQKGNLEHLDNETMRELQEEYPDAILKEFCDMVLVHYRKLIHNKPEVLKTNPQYKDSMQLVGQIKKSHGTLPDELKKIIESLIV